MPYCELLSTCPFFNDGMQNISEMTEMPKMQYCKGDYTWCGRYIVFKALEKDLERTNSFGLLSLTTGQNKSDHYKKTNALTLM